MKSLKFLFNTIAVLVCLFLLSNASYSKTLNFAIASDAHYLKDPAVNSSLYAAPKALRGFVDRVNEKNYDFVIFLGDNIDKSNEETLQAFLKTTKKIKTPYYLVMGNHDVHKISGLDKKEYNLIVSKENKYQKKAENSYYFYPSSDVIVIVLDSVSSGMPSGHGVFSSKTLKWLDEVLSKNKNKKALIFQHIPYYAPYEKPEYEILEKPEYKAVISRHDNILAIFSGHYHKESLYKEDNGIYHICVPALSLEPYLYTEIELKYDKVPLLKGKNFKLDGKTLPAI